MNFLDIVDIIWKALKKSSYTEIFNDKIVTYAA